MAKQNSLFDNALAAEGVTGPLATLARSIYMQESGGGKNTKTSNAGAMGGMQIIPSTFKSVADKDWDIKDPMQNARAGIRYLKQLDGMAGGDPALVAAGYYGGPGGMAKAKKGIAVSDPRNPNAPNTLEYAAQVVNRIGGKPVMAAQGNKAPVAPAGSVPEPVDAMGYVAQAAPVQAQPIMGVDTPVAQASYGPDPWAEFNKVAVQQQQVTPEALQFTGGFRQPVMDTPDFMAMAQYAKPVEVAAQNINPLRDQSRIALAQQMGLI